MKGWIKQQFQTSSFLFKADKNNPESIILSRHVMSHIWHVIQNKSTTTQKKKKAARICQDVKYTFELCLQLPSANRTDRTDPFCGLFQWQTWPRYHWRISSGAASAWTPTRIPSQSRVDTTSAWIASKATGTRRTSRSVRCAKRRSKSDRSWGSTELFPTWLNSSKGLCYFHTLCVPIPVSLLPLYKCNKSEGSNVRC